MTKIRHLLVGLTVALASWLTAGSRVDLGPAPTAGDRAHEASRSRRRVAYQIKPAVAALAPSATATAGGRGAGIR